MLQRFIEAQYENRTGRKIYTNRRPGSQIKRVEIYNCHGEWPLHVMYNDYFLRLVRNEQVFVFLKRCIKENEETGDNNPYYLLDDDIIKAIQEKYGLLLITYKERIEKNSILQSDVNKIYALYSNMLSKKIFDLKPVKPHKPIVILIGESHYSVACLLRFMIVIEILMKHNRRMCCYLEHPESEVDWLSRQHPTYNGARLTTFPYFLEMAIKNHYRFFAVDGDFRRFVYDLFRETGMEQRDEGMTHSIIRSLPEGDEIGVFLGGADHLPGLRARLADKCSVVRVDLTNDQFFHLYPNYTTEKEITEAISIASEAFEAGHAPTEIKSTTTFVSSSSPLVSRASFHPLPQSSPAFAREEKEKKQLASSLYDFFEEVLIPPTSYFLKDYLNLALSSIKMLGNDIPAIKNYLEEMVVRLTGEEYAWIHSEAQPTIEKLVHITKELRAKESTSTSTPTSTVPPVFDKSCHRPA